MPKKQIQIKVTVTPEEWEELLKRRKETGETLANLVRALPFPAMSTNGKFRKLKTEPLKA